MNKSSSQNQYLFVSSANRAHGNPWDFEVAIDVNMIKANKDEEVQMSLVQFTMPASLNQVNGYNNMMTFTNTATSQSTLVTIPDGTYNVYDLARHVEDAYAGVTITFLKAYNYFSFSFTQPHYITFTDDTNLLFGFSGKVTTTGTTIESDIAAKPTSIDDIILSVYGVTHITHNLSNLTTKKMSVTPMIGAIPVSTTIPFGVLTYANDSGEFAVRIQEKDVKKLRFVMSDTKGRVLDYCNLPDYTFIIKLAYNKQVDEMMALLKDLKEYSKLSFLANNLQQK